MQNKESLNKVWSNILAIDFTEQKNKMHKKEFIGWSKEKLEIIEVQYKRMLYIWFKYRDKILPTSEDIDEFWHYHILDTKKYHQDCFKIFGCYRHHNPYFGFGDKKPALIAAFADTLTLYIKEFREELYEIEEIYPK